MGKKKKKDKVGSNGKTMAQSVDRHVLYEEAVQTPDFDLGIVSRIYRNARKKRAHRLREDFCGTATLATEWVLRDPKNRAWGIDLDQPTLDWGQEHNISYLSRRDAARVNLLHGDVLKTSTPPVDVVLCLNFSCFLFKERKTLRSYFKQAYKALDHDGVMVMDVFGGQQAMSKMKDPRKIPKSKRRDGSKVPKYTYVWDQANFNAITHDILCHIHFKFSDGSRLNKAFTYDWRLWTVPELRELLEEAGFAKTDVYLHGWDDDGDSDDIYRKRSHYENELAWIAYVAAYK